MVEAGPCPPGSPPLGSDGSGSRGGARPGSRLARVAGPEPAAEEGPMEQGQRLEGPGGAPRRLLLVQQHGGAHFPGGEQRAGQRERRPSQSLQECL